MMDMIQKKKFSLGVAAGFCVLLYLAGVYCRPLFPVDETRYLSVAWEMYSGRDWLVPHLNLAPYHHKPPLLFWCINFLWWAFGVSQEVAMALPFICAFLLVLSTQHLAKKLALNEKNVATTTYVLIGFLPFVAYSNMIMFDILLSVFIVTGLTAIWDFTKTAQNRHLIILALCGGLGLLTKGPVIFLHLLFPVLLARYWNSDFSIPWRKWISNFTLTFLISLLIGLAWAVPASIKGGTEFSDRIFWGQTAGRMANSFDHQKPVWWYLPLLPLLLCPWIFSPHIWQSVKNFKTISSQPSFRFLLTWLVPTFLSFCFISGKQLHYLLPLLPGLSVLIVMGLKDIPHIIRFKILPFAIYGFLLSLPYIAKCIFDHDILTTVSLATTVLSLCALTACYLVSRFLHSQNPAASILAISLSSLILMINIELQAKDGLFRRYDLRPMAEIIERNPGFTLAFTRNYHGEWGFLSRLDRRVRQMNVEDMDMYLKYFPSGLIIVRTDDPGEVAPYDIIFSMPYKMQDRYYIIAKKGRGYLYSR